MSDNTLVSRWLTALILAALVYSIQIYPFYHQHHFHQDGLLEFEVSSHPDGVDVPHLFDHHDHDGDSSRDQGHQSHVDQQPDLVIIRVQTPRTPTLTGLYLYSSIPGDFTDYLQASSAETEEPFIVNRYQVRHLMFRGPPKIA